MARLESAVGQGQLPCVGETFMARTQKSKGQTSKVKVTSQGRKAENGLMVQMSDGNYP